MKWLYPDVVEPLPVPVVAPVRGWYPTLPDLPGRRAGLATALLVAVSTIVPLPVPFVQPLNAEPLRPVSRVQSSHVEPVRQGLVHAVDWTSPLSEPPRAARPRVVGEAVEPIRLGLVRELGWLAPLERPLPTRHSPIPDLAFVYAPVAVGPPPMAWLQPLGLPRAAARGVPLDLGVEPIKPWAPPPPIAYWHPILPAGPIRALRSAPHLLPPLAFVDATIPVVSGSDQDDKFTLGAKESVSVTAQPTLGGRWSW